MHDSQISTTLLGTPLRPRVDVVIDGDQAFVDGTLRRCPDEVDPHVTGVLAAAGVAVQIGRPVRVRARDELGTAHLVVAPSGQTRRVGSPAVAIGLRAAVALLILLVLGAGVAAASTSHEHPHGPPSAPPTSGPLPSTAHPSGGRPSPAARATQPVAPVVRVLRAQAKGHTIWLTVTLDGQPGTVTLTVTNAETGALAAAERVQIDETGRGARVAVRNVPAGRWRWHASAPGTRSLTGTVRVQESRTASGLPSGSATGDQPRPPSSQSPSTPAPVQHEGHAAPSSKHTEKPHHGLPGGPSGPSTGPSGPSGQ